MRKNPPEVSISDIYIFAMLYCNGIFHKEIITGSDRRKAFSFEESDFFNAVIKAFNNDVRFTGTVDGHEISLSPRSFARALQQVKSLIHS